ncbi:MAG TPA: non-homologous end-joining DNA ligase [Acidimicrobiales bacterium]|nr:non-homologous end-joining DNA ligase [Acidimicrobiales bacterium]
MTREPLTDYRRKRREGLTPEPFPPAAGGGHPPVTAPVAGPGFVIQEHHASSLHWDFRLEHDGVLVSWALPKGLPLTPDENHLAVHVEDHPMEYGSFSGTIPTGEYGGGQVSIWDRGTYECEKWTEREIKVVLHGDRGSGRFVLFPTKGKNWIIHRMDPPPEGFEPLPARLAPMLATEGPLPTDTGEWAFEFKWDGIRVLVWVDGGRARAISRGGNDITGSFPELRELGEAIGSDQVLLDGEIVVFDQDGRHSFSRLQHRLQVASPKDAARAALKDPASLVIFDLLHRNGRSFIGSSYDERRSELERLAPAGPSWAVTPSFTDHAAEEVFRSAVQMGMEGVVAKRRSSVYRPGVRSRNWVKVKARRTQEVVIGGLTPGQGDRRSTFGALLLGLPSAERKGTLSYVGKVGTGFTRRAREDLLAELQSLARSTSPFDQSLPPSFEKGATWARPQLVGEVEFREWTPDGRLRHPVWRGVRVDKSAKDVHREL